MEDKLKKEIALKLKKEITLINERAGYKELHRHTVAERIIRALIRHRGRAKAPTVKVKDLD